MRRIARLAALLLPLALLPAARAQLPEPPVAAVPAPAIQNAPAPRISVVTFAPGAIYWETYGHNALLVRDGDRTPLLFNYGIFDFHQKNFFLNFARGKMRYRLAVQPLDEALENYRYEQRWAREQPLILTPQQASQIYSYLLWNAQPEHAEYFYDYFRNNCSTRVRDVIDEALHGRLRTQLERLPADRTYRDEAVRHMASVPGLMVGEDAVLGPRADEPLTLWQQSFLPLTLMQALDRVTLEDGKPLVSANTVLLEGGEAQVLDHAPDLLLPLLITGCVMSALLLAAHAYLFRALLIPLSLISGLGGVILLLIWTFSDHWAMWQNHNLLLFSPLSLLLLPASGNRWKLPGFGVAVLIAIGAMASLALMLLPDAQDHLHWIALWLPVHLAIAWRLRPKPTA